ncbi:MAG: hypothetical protein ACTHKL_16095 [Streptosporangiaceae bacterium]
MTTLIQASPEKLRELQRLRRLKAERETTRLAKTDIFAALKYEPTPKQEVFHAATEFDVLFGCGSLRLEQWRLNRQ